MSKKEQKLASKKKKNQTKEAASVRVSAERVRFLRASHFNLRQDRIINTNGGKEAAEITGAASVCANG